MTRVTLEIEESKLGAIQGLTRQDKKSPALAMALDEYLDFKRRQGFVTRVMRGEKPVAHSGYAFSPCSA
jgi:hypothetical protein